MTRVSASTIAGAVGLVLAAALFASTLNRSLGSFSGDEARFVLLSRALAQGLGYIELQTPGHPPHTEYLPALPMLLLPITRWQDDNFLAMKIPILLCALLAVALVYFLFKTESQRLAWALAILLATMPLFLDYLGTILADVPYLAASLAALLWIDRACQRQDWRGRTWLLAGLLVALSFFFRPVGLALAAGTVAALVLAPAGPGRMARIKTSAVFLLAFGLPLGGWVLRNYLASGYWDREHFSKLMVSQQSNPFAGKLDTAGMLGRVERRIRFYARVAPEEIFPLEPSTLVGRDQQWGPPAFRSVLNPGILFFLGLGFLQILVRQRAIFAWYVGSYLVILFLWRFHASRFLIPIAPFLYYFGYRGVKLIYSLLPCFRSRQGFFQVGGWTLLVIFLLAGLFEILPKLSLVSRPLDYIFTTPSEPKVQAIQLVPSFRCYDYVEIPDSFQEEKRKSIASCVRYLRFLATAEWAHRHLSADAIVVCRKPTLWALLSRTYSIQFPAELDPEAMLHALSDSGAGYVLADETSPLEQKFMTLMQERYPPHFQEVVAFGQTRLLRLVR